MKDLEGQGHTRCVVVVVACVVLCVDGTEEVTRATGSPCAAHTRRKLAGWPVWCGHGHVGVCAVYDNAQRPRQTLCSCMAVKKNSWNGDAVAPPSSVRLREGKPFSPYLLPYL